ncbi:MAG TPA: hypothetical protein VFZ12_03710, partial [Dehalococcoidia bacterium]|nr:hypothetical protein [Dehalococcoidia bacterium]
MSQLPSGRWIAAAAMVIFMALALISHAFAVISERHTRQGQIQEEIRDILTTEEAREEFEEANDQDQDDGLRIPGTDIVIGLGEDLSYDEFVERTSDQLSEALYEGGPDEADELLRTLSVDEPGDSPLDFFAEPENDGLFDDVFGEGADDPLAFFEADEGFLGQEIAEVIDEAGDDEFATLDAHEAVTRLRLTFII